MIHFRKLLSWFIMRQISALGILQYVISKVNFCLHCLVHLQSLSFSLDAGLEAHHLESVAQTGVEAGVVADLHPLDAALSAPDLDEPPLVLVPVVETD
mgnify:FL=1